MPEIKFGSPTIDGNISVDVATELIKPGSGQTTIHKTAASNGATDVTIHTTTAGKTFYLVGLSVTNNSGNSALPTLDDGAGTPVWKMAIGTSTQNQNAYGDFSGTPLAYAATENVIINFNNASVTTNCHVNIWGWEE